MVGDDYFAGPAGFDDGVAGVCVVGGDCFCGGVAQVLGVFVVAVVVAPVEGGACCGFWGGER